MVISGETVIASAEIDSVINNALTNSISRK